MSIYSMNYMMIVAALLRGREFIFDTFIKNILENIEGVMENIGRIYQKNIDASHQEYLRQGNDLPAAISNITVESPT